nr:hypothetical protein [uncultured Allomuricauda sp.]
MKLRYIVIFSLCACWLSAQQTPDGQLFEGAAPIIAPQSPEAATFARYGSIPLTSASGQMSYSIPFHNISVDGNSWPVALNYNYGGLILEGKPSLMGLGWSVSGGGSVVREVRGLPDEHRFGYFSDIGAVGTKTVQDVINDYITGGIDNVSLSTIRRFTGHSDYDPLDGEADKYTVSVGGIHFSFKLGLDAQAGVNNDVEPVYLSQHGHKVRIIWSDLRNGYADSGNFEIDAIEVTDTNGIKYYFSNYEWTIPNGFEEFYLHTRTSWNLTYIEYLNGQQINFSYADHTFDDFNFTAAGAAIYAEVDASHSNGLIYSNPNYNDATIKSEIHRKILTGIDFPKGSIDLLTADRNETLSSNINIPERKVYTSIELRNKQSGNNLVQWFDFTHQGNRDLLTQINRNGEHHYSFEYYQDSTIPDFIDEETDRAYDQDKWKFYNGAGNTAALNIPNSIHTANKTPNFSKGRLGALKTITYPTKGNTTVKYQQNQIKTDLVLDSEYYNNLPASKALAVNYDGSNFQYDQNGDRIVSVTHTFNYPTLVSISHSLQGERYGNHLFFKIYRTDGATANGYPLITTPSYLSQYYQEAPYLREQIQQLNLSNNFEFPLMSPQLSYEFGPDDGAPGYVSESFNSNGKLVIMPGEYKFEIISSAAVPNSSATGLISVQLYGEFNQPPPQFANKNVGGLRVSEIVDCPDNSVNNCITRRFDYNDDDSFSTGTLYAVPLDKVIHSWQQKLIDGNTYYKEIHAYISEPFSVANASYGTPVFYSSIKESRVNDGLEEIGFEERSYSFPKENTNFSFPKRPIGQDLDKSLMEESQVFETGKILPVQKSETNYQMVRHVLDISNNQDSNPNHPWSFIVTKKQNLVVDFTAHQYNFHPTPGSADEVAVKDLYGFYPYKEVDNWDKVIQTRSTIDDIETVVDFGHNEFQIVNEQQVTDSRGNISKREIFYSSDFQSDPIYGAMYNSNQIGQPVLVMNYYNDVLQSQNKTEFVSDNNGYKPSKTLVAKADNDFEAKLGFQYEGNGRIRQVDQFLDSPNRPNDGSEKVLKSTSYIWGYGSEYPVAKIDNATYNDVVATGADLATLSSSNSSYQQRIDVLTALRNNLPSAFVSGYMYKPLVGVTDMVDPRGYATHYSYDHLNRLKDVKDEDEKMVQELEYAFRSANYTNPEDPSSYPSLGGTLSGPEDVQYNTSETYTVVASGGSQNYRYTWYKDGVFVTSGTTSITELFDATGTFNIRVVITDTLTGDDLTLERIVEVTNDLGTVNLTPSLNAATTEDNITFSASGINAGSGSLSYEWFVGPTEQSFTAATGFQNTFGTAGTYVVKLVVTDDVTLDSIEGQVSVQIYAPLNNPSINGDNSHITVGESINFTSSNIGGGSGSRTYQWYIKQGSGSFVLQSYTGQSNFYPSFNSAGTHTVKLVVTDTNVPTHSKEDTSVVNVYVPIAINASDITTPSPVTVGTSTYFNVNTASGGSGDYSYEWDVTNMDTNHNFGVGTFTEANKNVSSFTMGYEFYGSNTRVQCRVHDNLTGDYVTVFQTIVVNGSTPISATPITTKLLVDQPDHKTYRVKTTASGGSGTYTYKWTVDGVVVQDSTSETYESVAVTCGSDESDTVRVDVTDTFTGSTSVQLLTITITGCSSGGNQ